MLYPTSRDLTSHCLIASALLSCSLVTYTDATFVASFGHQTAKEISALGGADAADPLTTGSATGWTPEPIYFSLMAG